MEREKDVVWFHISVRNSILKQKHKAIQQLACKSVNFCSLQLSFLQDDIQSERIEWRLERRSFHEGSTALIICKVGAAVKSARM